MNLLKTFTYICDLLQLTIIPDNFMENVLNILRWDSDKNLQLLHQPVDKEKWTTEPAVVNAFYNPNKNDIGIFLRNNCVLKNILIKIICYSCYSLPCGNISAVIL